jgi:hypothetical protein
MTLYLLTAIGLTPGGSSTVHIYTQNNTINWLGECRLCPVFASYTLAFALQLRRKHGKTLVGGSGPVEAIGILQMVQQHTTASC